MTGHSLRLFGEITSWLPSWKYDIIANIWLSVDAHLLEKQSYLNHPNPICNDGALDSFEENCPIKKNGKMSTVILDQFLVQKFKDFQLSSSVVSHSTSYEKKISLTCPVLRFQFMVTYSHQTEPNCRTQFSTQTSSF